jgi:hypothetical protein
MVGAPSGFRLQLPSAKWTKSADARTDNLRFQQVPTHSEDILDDTVQAEEPFSLTGRLEATHVPFPLTGRLMRGLDTIVGVPSVLWATPRRIVRITETTLMLLQISSILGTELLAPDSNGFIRNNNSTFGEKSLDITEAHAEAMTNLRWRS